MARSLLTLAVLILLTPAWAADRIVIEDWTKPPLGAKGIPADWKGQDWGAPVYDMTIVENDGHRVLHLRSNDEGSTIAKDIKGQVDLKQTPMLEWTWKAVVLPRGGDSRKKALDDQAAQLYVVWPRFPGPVRSRIIGYVWDTTAPVGTIARSEKTGTVMYVVVRSGTADLGKWVTERRNVREDFRRIYGEEPESPGAISIGIDSNDTKSSAESYMGAIVFTRP